MKTKHVTLVAIVVAVALAAGPVLAVPAANVYIAYNVYDNTAVDNYWYYSYEMFADQELTQTVSKWYLEIDGAPNWQEVATSPQPTGGLPAADSSDASGYTQGNTWHPAVEVDIAPAENLTGLGTSLLWETLTTWGNDEDGDGIREHYEPGVDNNWLATYAGSGPPTAPGVQAVNTDVPLGWFQFRSTGPPIVRPYRIDNGKAEWFGNVEGPTPEPVSLLLLLVGVPAAALARRRRN